MLSLSYLTFNLFLLTSAQPGEKGAGAGTSETIGTTEEISYCDVTGLSAEYREVITEEATANRGYVRNIIASGCPNHPHFLLNPNRPQINPRDVLIPAYPCFSDQDPYDVLCTAGTIGMTIGGGVSIYSVFAGGQCTPDNDAVVAEADTFDNCSGHASPGGDYHYHVAPACLLDQLGDSADSVDGHSPLIGWAYDGFPVYGPHGTDGEYIYPCGHNETNIDDCLDSCNGHEQHEIDGFKYHYHITGPIGDLESMPISPYPDTDMSPYTIGCLKGVPFDWDIISGSNGGNGASCLSNGYTDDYVAEAIEGLPVYGDITPSPLTDDMTPEPTSLMEENCGSRNLFVRIFFIVCMFGFLHY